MKCEGKIRMANLENRSLYGYTYTLNNINEAGIDTIGVQYHITTKCDLKCKHCYMGNSDGADDKRLQDMSLDESRTFLLEFEKYLLRHKKRASMYITGGDPILSEKFWDTLSMIKKSKCLNGTFVLGNSYHLNNDVVCKLKSYGVYAYQISIDGLEEKHDENRRKGSFQDALRALRLLHNIGIQTYVMFTVSKSNCEDFIPLYRLLDNMGIVDQISFDKMIPMGEARKRNDYVSPKEYKDFLLEVYKFIVFEKPHTMFGFKDNLWKLLLAEQGMVTPYKKDKQGILNGCLACDCSSITILADGTVMPCRRLDIELGKYPKKSFEELLDNNEFYTALCDKDNYVKCRTCDLFPFCRGCLAVKYSMNGSIFAEDKYCWREINE